MSFDPYSLLAGALISLVGFAAFTYGRRQQRASPIVAGLALMVFPYFVPGIGWAIAIAVGLLGLMGLCMKLGF